MIKEHVIICPDCKGRFCLMKSRVGYWYCCENYPKCTGGIDYTQCDQQTGKPLCKPADRQTRELRHKVHLVFDELWDTHRISRTKAYRWLARKMGIRKSQCHIGLFSEAQCTQAIELIVERLFQLRGNHDAIYVGPKAMR